MRYEIPENYHQKQRSDEEAAEEAQMTQTPCRSPLPFTRDPYVTYSRHLFASAEDLVHYSAGIMQNSKAEKLRKLASKRQIVRAKDARELGIP